MEDRNTHLRHILLFYYRKEKNASQVCKKICEVYGEDALKERQCRNWFDKFRKGDFSLKDEHRSGRPLDVNDDEIRDLIKKDRHRTTRGIARKLSVSHATIESRIQHMGSLKT